jgi:uncharacterized protein (TIGR02996 family)
MSTLDSLLEGIVTEPSAEDRWHVVADWLEEHDDPRRAELLRLHRRLLATCCEPDRHPERATWQARVVDLLARGVRPCVPQQTLLLGKRSQIPITFAWVSPGSFLMGCPPDEEGAEEDEPLHRVTLSRGFWLAVHPVTQAQWRRVNGRNPSQQFRDDRSRPADRVTWTHCQDFCRRLGEMTGQRFRLPTEAEWEYACRAGTTTPFFFGETISVDQANYRGELRYGRGRKGLYRGKPTPVGTFPPNAWGLYDLHGNVREWCQDWEGAYPDDRVVDPAGAEDGTERVLRGGSWRSHPMACRSARRGWLPPACVDNEIGCRVCLWPG